MASTVIITAKREGYSKNQIRKTLTVGELVNYLSENFDLDSKLYLSHDNGYTFGGITYNDIEENWDEEESFDEEETDC